MSRTLLVSVAASAIGVAAACNHAPAEPITTDNHTTAAPGPSAAPSATVATAKPRCVVPTSETPTPKAPPPGKCPPDPQGGPPFAKVATVSFPDAASISVEAELALTDDETERGLMYRTKMPEGHGMLFAMTERKQQTFWMHNTCLSLDMLFLDDDGFIVGILENVPTLNDDIRSVACPSSYVLEVNAGWCRAHGVRAGQKAVLPPVHPAR